MPAVCILNYFSTVVKDRVPAIYKYICSGLNKGKTICRKDGHATKKYGYQLSKG
jgi:hypothetical protein